jgi:L-ascorbate metabolism protein UlaG (beta-lactamase superfamily)
MFLTWLDANSWLIEIAGQRILLDPWLVGSLVFGNQPWFFKGERPLPPEIPEQIDLILLSQGLPDHAHLPTLKQLDRTIPVIASENAAKVVQKLGYTQVTPLGHGETSTWADRLEITALPGSPIGPFLVENAFVLTDLTTHHRLYYEPHGFHAAALQQLETADVVIAPIQDLILPLLGPFIQGGDFALAAVKQLQPQYILPTASGGEVEYAGLLDKLLTMQGSIEGFRQLLQDNKCSTQVLSPAPGERVEVNLSSAVAG